MSYSIRQLSCHGCGAPIQNATNFMDALRLRVLPRIYCIDCDKPIPKAKAKLLARRVCGVCE
jgi:hypothetical protein